MNALSGCAAPIVDRRCSSCGRPALADAFSCAGGAGVGYHRAGFCVTGIDINPQPRYPFHHIVGDAVDYLRLFGDRFAARHASPPCFPAGTPVLTDRGVTAIESVAVGDCVLTHTGRWRSVTATMSRKAEVVADNWLATTADHPFWARERVGRHRFAEPVWTAAAELRGKYVAVPAVVEPLPIPPVPGRAVSLGQPFWYAVGRWLGDGWVRRVKSDPENRPRRPHGRLFTEEQQCRQCGEPAVRAAQYAHLWNAYCSKTCRDRYGRANRVITRGDVLICCANEEADGLFAKLADTGLHWAWSHERTTTRFAASHVGLADWLTENFGRYAHGKTLPAWLFGADETIRLSLLDGYLDADGFVAQGGYAANTVSANLAIGMRLLAAGLGYDTSVSLTAASRAVSTIEGRDCEERPLWKVSMNPRVTRKFGHFDGGHWWGARRTELRPRGVETVYDLTVEEDHSFVAWGFVVHNCQSSSALTKGNRKRDGWTDTHVDLIPDTRAVLAGIEGPSVIENVQGSGLRRDLTLCGETFGLEVIRHRYFEVSGFDVEQPPHLKHRGRVAGLRHGEWFTGPYFAVYGDGGGKGTVAEWQRAMGGMTWTSVRKEIAEAIPMAYAQYIGAALMASLEQEQVAA